MPVGRPRPASWAWRRCACVAWFVAAQAPVLGSPVSAAHAVTNATPRYADVGLSGKRVTLLGRRRMARRMSAVAAALSTSRPGTGRQA